MYLLIVLVVTLAFIYKLATWNNDYFRKRGIPYMEPLPLIGNIKDIVLKRENIVEFLGRIYNQFKGHPFGGWFLGTKPVIVACDPSFVKMVMTDTEHFTNRAFQPDPIGDPIAAKLFFFLKDNAYKEMAPRFRPAFSIGQVKKMFCDVNGKVHTLLDTLDDYAKSSQVVDILDNVDRFCVDNTMYVVSGVECNSFKDRDNVLLKTARILVEPSLRRVVPFGIVALSPRLGRFLGITMVEKETIMFVRKLMTDVYNERKAKEIVRNDFADYLLKEKLSEPGVTEQDLIDPKTGLLSDEAICMITTFLIASTETNARGAAFALYEMALNPKIQEKLHDEIYNTLKETEGKLTYETLQKMEYLDKVASESLRLHPAFPITNRECKKTFNVPETKFIIEKGMHIYFPMYGLHYDPEYYPDPYVFDPERFSEENKKSRPSFSYIPFGGGPRMCTATKYALMVLKVIMVNVLNKFELYTCDETPIRPRLHPYVIFLEPREHLNIKLRKREVYHNIC